MSRDASRGDGRHTFGGMGPHSGPTNTRGGPPMSSRKLISVVTPCYNEEDNVLDCYRAVRRIFEQELPEYDYEHIFCDNCSTDTTVAHLRSLAEQDRRV